MTQTYGATMDVTTCERVEEALQESEARFRIVVDSAPALIWMSGPDKRYNFFNKPWQEFTGQTIELETAAGWVESLHPDDLPACRNTYAASFDARQPFTMVYRLRRHDGEYRWVSEYGVPRSDRTGAFAGYIGYCLDITERLQAEEALRRSLVEIQTLKDHLQAERNHLRIEVEVAKSFREITGQSVVVKRLQHEIEQVAPVNCAVLITGETGTGKELIAQGIHRLSQRGRRNLITVNCAALPTALVESELFGREKGAYTGALTRQAGRFEVADGSTIFLDEVAEIPLETQAKLLRVLQEGEFQRLGSTLVQKVDARVIAATNRDLAEEVRQGRFRQDLFYRLNVFPIQVPPLRDRAEDIPALVSAFVAEFSTRIGKKITKIPRRVMNDLQRHSWPGNIRELQNVIEHGIILSKSEVLEVPPLKDVNPANAMPRTLAENEAHHILMTLRKTGGRIKGPHGAAKLLDMDPGTLYSRMRRLKISDQRQKVDLATRG